MIGYSLTLPLGPSINHYWRKKKGGGFFISEEGVAFRKEVWLAVKQAKVPTLSGRVCVIMRVFPRDKRKIDLDNRAKACLDALQKAGVYADDEQVDELNISRGSIIQGGRMEVMVGEIGS